MAAYKLSKAYKEAAAKAEVKAAARAERKAQRAHRAAEGKWCTTTGSIKGRTQWRRLATAEARRQVGRSKGGLVAAARGTSHRWTSEEASKAAKKGWRKRGRIASRLGIRVGRRLARAKPLTENQRELLRIQYAKNPSLGITCRHVMGKGYVWGRIKPCPNPNCLSYTGGFCPDCLGSRIVIARVISERHALRTLGHLRMKTKFIPETILPVPTGKRSATVTQQEE